MNIEPRFEQCLTFINCQLHPAHAFTLRSPAAKQWRAVTISRQAGAGGHAVAQALTAYLQDRETVESPPWTVFDRNLVERVLEDHQLSAHLAKFMPEDRVSAIDDVLEELCGLHPSAATLVEKTSETILRLAEWDT